MTGKTNWPTAIISGGASGIGLRLAEMLRAQGTATAVLDRAISDEARRKLSTPGGPPASFHEVDVRDAAALAAAVKDAVAAIGQPALAVNSAGVQISAAFTDLTEEQFRTVIEINLIGSRNFAAAVLPVITTSGRIALVASLAGIIPNHGYAAYSASKFGVVGLAGCLRLECKPRDIEVSVICPPEVETPMVDDERRTGDKVGLELKKFSGTLELDDACDQIMHGLIAGRWMIIPGRRARVTRRLAQLMPGVMNKTGDRMVRRALAHGGR